MSLSTQATSSWKNPRTCKVRPNCFHLVLFSKILFGMKNIILQYHFTRLFVCGFSLIFFIPGYLILLIIPGMTIINRGRILMNPAMTVAPFAWEMLLAASNLWTITYVQRKDDKLTRFKTIKYLKAPSMNLFCSFRNHIWTSSVSITGKYIVLGVLLFSFCWGEIRFLPI